MIKKKGMEYSLGQMAVNIMDNGWMESKRELVYIIIQKTKCAMANGKMGKG
jgi:hypothetical protein